MTSSSIAVLQKEPCKDTATHFTLVRCSQPEWSQANPSEAGDYGPRLLRLGKVTNFSIHDVALIDAPAFHLVMDSCSSGEIYNMIIRGGNEGGLDGIDIWGSNIHVHDVEVGNRDECVTVKVSSDYRDRSTMRRRACDITILIIALQSPAKNMLIENIYCNWSGGSAMGSLGTDTGNSPPSHTHDASSQASSQS